MLDISFIRDNQDLVTTVCKNKNVKVDVKKFLELDKKRSATLSKLDDIRHKRNQLSAQSKSAKPEANSISRATVLKSEIIALEKDLKKVEQSYKATLQLIPNLYSKNTPIGHDDKSNKVIRKVGEPSKLDFKPLAHWELGPSLGLIDFERAAKVSGARFSYLRGNLVKLQFALLQYALDVLSDEEIIKKIQTKANLKQSSTPFIPILVPAMIKRDMFAKTGRLDPVEDKYYLEKDDLFLAGSAEHTLASMHAGEVLELQKSPIRYVGYSTAFRREAGSYGKDVRGILRQHQFDKLEMESFSSAEDGENEQLLMVAIQEYLMSSLGLAYQVVAISTGDMGKPDYQQFDIETWLPSQNEYRETQTADYVTDYQARSLQIKYVDQDGVKQFAHMNDGTVFALGRTMLAIMENYQTKEGRVTVPKVLRKYMGGGEYL